MLARHPTRGTAPALPGARPALPAWQPWPASTHTPLSVAASAGAATVRHSNGSSSSRRKVAGSLAPRPVMTQATSKAMELESLDDASPGYRTKPLLHAQRHVADMAQLLEGCGTWQQLGQLVGEWDDRSRSNRRLVVAALRRASELAPPPAERHRLAPRSRVPLTQLLDTLCAWALGQCDRLQPRDATALLEALARLGHPAPRLREALTLFVRESAPRLFVSDLFRCLAALACLAPSAWAQAPDPCLLQRALEQGAKAMRHMAGEDVGNAAMALARLDPARFLVPPPWLAKLAHHSLTPGVMEGMGGVGLMHLAHLMARQGYRPSPQWRGAFAAALAPRLPPLLLTEPRAPACLLAACHALGVQLGAGEVGQIVARLQASPGCLQAASGEELAGLVAGLAASGDALLAPPSLGPLLRPLVDALQRKAGALGPGAAARAVMDLGNVLRPHLEPQQHQQQQAGHGPGSQAQQLTNPAPSSPNASSSLSTHAATTKAMARSSSSSSAPPQPLLPSLPELLDELLACSEGALAGGSMGPGELARLSKALAWLGHEPDTLWRDALLAAVMGQMDRLVAKPAGPASSQQLAGSSGMEEEGRQGQQRWFSGQSGSKPGLETASEAEGLLDLISTVEQLPSGIRPDPQWLGKFQLRIEGASQDLGGLDPWVAEEVQAGLRRLGLQGAGLAVKAAEPPPRERSGAGSGRAGSRPTAFTYDPAYSTHRPGSASSRGDGRRDGAVEYREHDSWGREWRLHRRSHQQQWQRPGRDSRHDGRSDEGGRGISSSGDDFEFGDPETHWSDPMGSVDESRAAPLFRSGSRSGQRGAAEPDDWTPLGGGGSGQQHHDYDWSGWQQPGRQWDDEGSTSSAGGWEPQQQRGWGQQGWGGQGWGQHDSPVAPGVADASPSGAFNDDDLDLGLGLEGDDPFPDSAPSWGPGPSSRASRSASASDWMWSGGDGHGSGSGHTQGQYVGDAAGHGQGACQGPLSASRGQRSGLDPDADMHGGSDAYSSMDPAARPNDGYAGQRRHAHQAADGPLTDLSLDLDLDFGSQPSNRSRDVYNLELGQSPGAAGSGTSGSSQTALAPRSSGGGGVEDGGPPAGVDFVPSSRVRRGRGAAGARRSTGSGRR